MSSQEVAATGSKVPRKLFVDLQPMGPFQDEPFVIERGEGIRLYDDTGRSFIDGLSGAFVVSLGHGNQRMVQAAADQAAKVAFAQPFYATTEPAIEFADRLTEMAMPGLEAVKLTAVGSEATEAAIKLARHFHLHQGSPRRVKVLSHHRSYHGSTGNSLAASGALDWKRAFEPHPAGFIHVHAPFSLQGKIPALAGDEDAAADAALALIAESIEQEGPETVAAFITEPVMLSAGVRIPPRRYLKGLAELCREHGVLLIFDEIITGFGRTGKMFAAEHFGATPDMLCFGKGISSGYAPLGGILVNERVAKPYFEGDLKDVPFLDAHTYGNNPVAAAVGLEALRQLEERELLKASNARGEQLRASLREADLPGVRDVRGLGLLVGIEFDNDIGQAVWEAGRSRGLITRAGKDFVAIGPPLITTEAEIEEIASIVRESIEDVAK